MVGLCLLCDQRQELFLQREGALSFALEGVCRPCVDAHVLRGLWDSRAGRPMTLEEGEEAAKRLNALVADRNRERG